MKKVLILLVFSLLLFSFGSVGFINALSPIEYPDCFVEGKITSVNFVEAEDTSVNGSERPAYPDRFILSILIDKVKTISTDGSFKKDCSEWRY